MVTSEIMASEIRVGRRFRHARQLDTDWIPSPGQKYADAPKRVMVISRVTRTTVYYKTAGEPEAGAGWANSRDTFPGVVGEWLD